ncbi:MAG: hypothetical protein JW714_00115 [Candidatus Omnitrophica bacterium]|nr:hypothetical protein [Candidatus Omnitrophota bacterium]
MRKIKKKKLVLFTGLTTFLLFFAFSEVQSADWGQEKLQLVSAQLTEAQAISPLISMDFQDADLKDVLKVFSQQAGLNFIASENIKDRKVTLYLDRVTVQDALDTIMSANNLTYEQERESSIFIVKELGRPEVETVTKIFPLQYARVIGTELTDEGKKKKETTKIGIRDVIEELLTKNGNVIEDGRTNSLVITDVPSQFVKIEQAIKELDVKLPQVMIEAEVVEASLETVDKLGIAWGTSSDGYFVTGAGSARTTTWPFLEKGEGVGTAGNVSGLTMGYLSMTNLGGTLAMLAKDTDTKILARPRILTLNNETAEINIRANTAVSSGTTQISAEGGIATSTITIERFETGVSLMVTPQINKAGEITMSIEPSVITTKASSVLGSSVSDPQERSARTTVSIRDGETVVIGGLINTEDSKINRKVPFLGDIPLLGNVFRKQDDSSTDKELIIFITPHLVKDGSETPGLALEKSAPWEYERLGLKEEAMERLLDRIEE